ncbi:Peroxidase 41 [Raphanus sativus]|uniref:Peroxidase n=1 Tax=Raphanus sativus TaxID=3726 RepID=A0A6J0MB86_RAPSA|nr:peroxidase 41 [Raphanus sativus]KAJ4912529.1 Peroxidase 41 [Raphanus sativus]
MPSFPPVIFLLLVFIPSVLSAPVTSLTNDYYQETCPDFSKIVREVVTTTQGPQGRTAAGILRLFFHDCFLEGCDASVLIAKDALNKSERDDEINHSLTEETFEIVTRIKTALEKSCPGVVSCADILAQSTHEAVTMIGGPSYEVKLGRKDGCESKARKVGENLPLPNHTVHEMMSLFQKKGFTLKEMVALSGAHTIGIAHCKDFICRVTGPRPDLDIDAEYAEVLKSQCKDYTVVNETRGSFFDPVTPDKFDNMYYKNLENGRGLLASDNILFKDNSTRPFVELYANNQTVFFEDFARAMEKLGMVGVKVDKNGDVRLRCDNLNKPKEAILRV